MLNYFDYDTTGTYTDRKDYDGFSIAKGRGQWAVSGKKVYGLYATHQYTGKVGSTWMVDDEGYRIDSTIKVLFPLEMTREQIKTLVEKYACPDSSKTKK